MPRFLRQLGRNKAPFIWTEKKAQRKDMVEYDPAVAETRLEALKRKLAALESEPDVISITPEETAEAKEIAELEAKIKAIEERKAGITVEKKEDRLPSEILAEKRQKIIDEDDAIAKIRAMRKIKSVADYLVETYGIVADEAMDIDQLKEIACQERIKVIFEKE